MRVLRIGLKGDDVKELQKLLGITVDGYFGPMTNAAVKEYQAAHGLKDDGIVGPLTRAKMGFAAPAPVLIINPKAKYQTLAQIDAHLEKGTVPWYEAAYLIQTPDRGYEKMIERAARRVMKNKAMYERLQKLTGIPWVAPGLIMDLEAASNITCYLGNGQSLSRRTTIVPKGRGPFTGPNAWIDGALDAIGIQPIWRPPNWSIGQILKICELWNGTGYLRYHHSENSPYIWGCTSINDGTGKYVSDGKWSETANANAQVGVAAIAKQLSAWGEFMPTFSTIAG